MHRGTMALLVAGFLALAAGPTAAALEPDSPSPAFVPVVGLPASDVPLPPKGEAVDVPVTPDGEAAEDEASAPAPPADLRTAWGFGARENLYNDTILQAVGTLWPHAAAPLPPALFKALVAAESSFNPGAVSATGAAGLVQLTPDTARRFGLCNSDRSDPEAAVPVGVQVLAEKTLALLDPANYHRLLGRKPEDCPYALRVARAYEELGPPGEEQLWPLVLAAYNGGGGTVLRAMAVACERGQDPRDWASLVGDRSHPASTPLYAGCVQVYGRGAAGKYREMVRYPEKVLELFRKAMK